MAAALDSAGTPKSDTRETITMNILRSAARALLAAVLVAFVTPASAVDKIYSLNVSPSVPAGATSTITAIFKNETPSGNSSFNSLTLNVAGGLSIVGVSVPHGTASPVASPTSPQQTINVQGMSPVKNGKSFTITLTVKAAPASGCAAASATWSSTTWTGSSLSGDNFLLQTQLSSLTTNMSTSCSMGFVTQPTNALSMGLIGGPVKVQVSPASSFTGKSITLGIASAPSGSPTFAGGTNVAPVDASGFATFPNLSITGPAGVYQLSASTLVGGDPTATSATFNIAASDGVINCSEALDPTFTMPDGVVPITQTGYAAGSRGAYNKTGNLCERVAYDFANDIVASNTAKLRWDTNSQPGAAFAYTVTWNDEVPDLTSGVPTRRTKVAWEFDGSGNPLPGKTVFGVSCLSPSLPAPYGTLNADYGGTIEVTTSGAVPALPFPIAVGNERMKVTAIAGPIWTVTRGEGGTTAVPHDTGSAVMSTPLPIDPNKYLPGTTSGAPDNPYYLKQAQMCIADEGWVAVPGGKVRFTTTVFDIGDGFIIRDF